MLHILHTGTQTIMEDKTGHTRELLKAMTMSSPFPPNHKEKKNEDNRLEVQEREDKRLCFHYEARISRKEPTENSIFMKIGMG